MSDSSPDNSNDGLVQSKKAVSPDSSDGPKDSKSSKEWPVAEGRYKVGNTESPVAVCTMASVEMDLPLDRIAIKGKCVTENLGVEKIIKNTISNPKIRYIIFCGKESHGHFVGQAVKSLKDNGIDAEKRIIGAKGGMPILKNLKPEEIERFREQVEPIDMSGEEDRAKILVKVNELFDNNPGVFQGEVMNMEEEIKQSSAETHPVSEWEKDPQGFFTIRPDTEKGEIIAEHHSNEGNIRVRITGKSAEDMYHHIIKNSLISRQDHAAYLGRELARAEVAMLNNLDYEQDAHVKVSNQPTSQDNGQDINQASNQASNPSLGPSFQRDGQETRKPDPEQERPSIPGPVPMNPVQKPEIEKPKISMEERVRRLAESVSAREEAEKKPKGRTLTYYKGYREIELADATNPDHEFRAFLRDRGMSRVF